MGVKRIMSSLMITLMSITFLTACTATPMTDSKAQTPMDVEMMELTLDELKEFNGQDGNKAYIAVDGEVYDVTDIEPWAGGMHADQFQAGEDYTEEIKTMSPHGLTPLEDLKPIGKIKE